MDIEEVLARMEIQKVLWTYARGVDRADYETMASVYHPDGTDDHSTFSGLGKDFARIVVDWGERLSIVGQHHITNVLIEMDGKDDARAESYFLSFHPHAEDGQQRLGIAAGRYLDHFQRRDGSWKIAARRVVMDWTRDRVDGAPWDGVDGLPAPGRVKSRSDESYKFFS
jgi:hypothetical protein